MLSSFQKSEVERILERVGYNTADLKWTGMQEFPFYQRELAPSRLPADTQVCWDPGSGYFFAFYTSGVEWRGVFSPSKAFVRASYVVDSWHSIPGFLYIWAEELGEELKGQASWKGAEDASGGRNLLKRSQLNAVGQALQESGVDLSAIRCHTTGAEVVLTVDDDDSIKFVLSSPSWTTFSGTYHPGSGSFSDLNWVKVFFEFRRWGKGVHRHLQMRRMSAEERAERERQLREEEERLAREKAEEEEKERREREEQERLAREKAEQEEQERLERERLEREEAERLAREEQDKEQLIAELAKERELRAQLEKELAEVKQQLAEEQEKGTALHDQVKSLEQMLAEERALRQKLEQELAEVKEQLAQESRLRQQAEGQAPELQQRLTQLSHQKQQLEAELQARDQQKQEEEARRQAFRDDLWRLKSFRLEGIRRLPLLEHQAPEDPRSLSLIVGSNGAGKTTTLVALALGLAPLGETRSVLRTPAAAGLLGYDRDQGVIGLEFEGPDGQVVSSQTHLARDARGQLVVTHKDPVPDLLVVGLGAARVTGGLPLSSRYSVLESCGSLLGLDPRLADTELVLRRLKLTLGLESFQPFLTQLAKMVPVEGIGFELDDLLGLVVTGAGVDRLPFEQWSNGLRGVVAWVAQLIGWALVTGRLGDDLNAVVLLDEVDLHLQPNLQARILANLCEGLPGVQFFTTTLATTVVRTALPDELVQLERPT